MDNYMQDEKAKSIEGFIEALNILSRYTKDGINQKFFCGAEHDVLYLYTDNGQPSEDSRDGVRLSALGFHFEDGVESWAYFT